MANYFSDHQSPCFYHWSEQNFVSPIPLVFTSYYYYSDHFTVNDPNNYLIKPPSPPPQPPTINPRIGTWGRGGVKAYFRFHGGIGDGCCGMACRYTGQNTIARPLQLFDALYPIDFYQIPAIGDRAAEASNGTGVFLPVYPKKNRKNKGMSARGPRGVRGGKMKQEDTFPKPSAGGDVAEKKEIKDIDDDIPIELLLPSEWPYETYGAC
ncbi:hypothetical protein QVD17_14857 [Tagetes erecta]|uniref:Uncharacterized protein n=1 Tax=Tagetes erecta TaxID=13708 RepID=A0AAD8KR89_TARER|nr:hypothetical protein QVD17_14857 [Tagetes erecta]